MNNKIVNQINKKVINKYFGINNVKFLDEKNKDWRTNGGKGDLIHRNIKQYRLIDNTKMGVFAEALNKLYIEVIIDIEDTDDKFERKGKYNVEFRYEHIDGGGNGCGTDIGKRFIATCFGEDSEVNLQF